MKHKIIILQIILLAGIFSGCKKYLDLAPRNQRTVTSVDNIEALLGAYLKGVAELRVKPLYGSVMAMVPAAANVMFEAYSDNLDFELALTQTYLQPNNNKEKTQQGYGNLLLWNQHATATTVWTQHYEIIGFMNSLIGQMDAIGDASPAQRDQLLGEMYVHRAFFFFKLLQYFAPYDKSEMGIPVYLNTGDGVLGIQLPRSSHAAVYKTILDDLNKAQEMINRTNPWTGFNCFYNKRYINHLLAQVYWFKAESPAKETSDYEKVKTYSLAALEAVDAYIPVTAAARINAYAAKDPNYPAHCMENNTQGGISVIYGNEFQYLSPGTYGPENIPITAEFAGLFEQSDIRIANYFNMDATRAGGKVGTAGKTLNWGWPTDGSANGQYKRGDLCLFKPEEAYLMLAEAYYKLTKEGDALTTLNKFRSFRGTGTLSGVSGAPLLQEIINERRREFFCDSDKRWLDLKRYANKTITRSLTILQKPYNITVPPNDFRYALPIPLTEIQQNRNIVPNPGWVIMEF
jgi:hypothetical protein